MSYFSNGNDFLRNAVVNADGTRSLNKMPWKWTRGMNWWANDDFTIWKYFVLVEKISNRHAWIWHVAGKPSCWSFKFSFVNETISTCRLSWQRVLTGSNIFHSTGGLFRYLVDLLICFQVMISLFESTLYLLKQSQIDMHGSDIDVEPFWSIVNLQLLTRLIPLADLAGSAISGEGEHILLNSRCVAFFIKWNPFVAVFKTFLAMLTSVASFLRWWSLQLICN